MQKHGWTRTWMYVGPPVSRSSSAQSMLQSQQSLSEAQQQRLYQHHQAAVTDSCGREPRLAAVRQCAFSAYQLTDANLRQIARDTFQKPVMYDITLMQCSRYPHMLAAVHTGAEPDPHLPGCHGCSILHGEEAGSGGVCTQPDARPTDLAGDRPPPIGLPRESSPLCSPGAKSPALDAVHEHHIHSWSTCDQCCTITLCRWGLWL